MKVNTVAYTQWDPEFKHSGSDDGDIIAYAARVSNPDNQVNFETADKLLSYLLRKHHWSPWEMASITMEVETTRDIARQILRHRSFSFQEFSQRYADPSKSLGFVTREARLQDTKNRQNSFEISPTDHNADVLRWWNEIQLALVKEIQKTYNLAIDSDIAKEVARAILPEGMTVSRLYMAGTLRSWIHYVGLRTQPGTQKEHREVAEACKRELTRVYPVLGPMWPTISAMFSDAAPVEYKYIARPKLSFWQRVVAVFFPKD